MIILSVRTDTSRSYVGLTNDYDPLIHIAWDAHRQLATTLYSKIDEALKNTGMQLSAINAVVCYQGPGSFTGLRIGLTAANAISFYYGIPIVAEQGDDWNAKGIDRLLNGENGRVTVPFYGSDAHITVQKK